VTIATTTNAAARQNSTGSHPQEKSITCSLPGFGGLDLGFAKAGFTPVLAIDANAAACQTYERNHSATRVLKRDLSTLPRRYVLERLSELSTTIKPIGILGGPPCQAFSQGNCGFRKF
jgi:site-specific DNA-cytosine methylase